MTDVLVGSSVLTTLVSTCGRYETNGISLAWPSRMVTCAGRV